MSQNKKTSNSFGIRRAPGWCLSDFMQYNDLHNALSISFEILKDDEPNSVQLPESLLITDDMQNDETNNAYLKYVMQLNAVYLSILEKFYHQFGWHIIDIGMTNDNKYIVSLTNGKDNETSSILNTYVDVQTWVLNTLNEYLR